MGSYFTSEGQGNCIASAYCASLVLRDKHIGNAINTYLWVSRVEALLAFGNTVYAFRLPPEIAAGRRGFPPANEMQDLYVYVMTTSYSPNEGAASRRMTCRIFAYGCMLKIFFITFNLELFTCRTYIAYHASLFL